MLWLLRLHLCRCRYSAIALGRSAFQTAETSPTPSTPFALLPTATPLGPFTFAPEPVSIQSKQPNLMSKLQAPDKEATVRFTVDMSESLHRKLSMLAAKTGRKKVDQNADAASRTSSRRLMDRGDRSLPQRIEISKVYRTDAGTRHILFVSVLSFMRQTATFQLLSPKTVG